MASSLYVKALATGALPFAEIGFPIRKIEEKVTTIIECGAWIRRLLDERYPARESLSTYNLIESSVLVLCSDSSVSAKPPRIAGKADYPI